MELTDFLVFDESGKTAHVKNWKKLEVLRNEDFRDSVIDKLKQDGILVSPFQQGTFYLVGCGMALRPNLGLREFNFSTIEHAQNYQEKYKDAQYPVDIVQKVA